MRILRLGRVTAAITLVCAAMSTPSAAAAASLTETLINAYQMSPALDAERARLRATDERVAQARVSRRPTLDASISADFGTSVDSDWDVSSSYSAMLRSSLLIYDNGQSAAAIAAAKAVVASSRAQLRQAEQDVLLAAVAAHMDVRRDLQSVAVANNNVEVLQQQVQATRDRFELGEVTRTDVSLSEARLAAAEANLAAIQGRLEASREAYRAIVGVPASNLEAPPALPQIPANLADVEAIAISRHPLLEAARYAETAAQYDLTRSRAARGPSVSIGSNLTYSNSPDIGGGRDRDTSLGVGVTGTVPIYRGGQLSSVVRQAEAQLAQAKFDVQDIARTIRQNAAVAWSNLAVARASIAANRQQVQAARIAFEGVQEEATLGARTTLDVLDLEQELRNAELQLASSLRDEYVAAYQLLSSMGLLNVTHLGLGIPTYDPDVNYNRVQGAPFSTVEGGILEQLRDRYSR